MNRSPAVLLAVTVLLGGKRKRVGTYTFWKESASVELLQMACVDLQELVNRTFEREEKALTLQIANRFAHIVVIMPERFFYLLV